MAGHRLFVAARPPAAVCAALTAAMGGVPDARWQTDEQLHVTLRFIGEVDRHQAEDIAVALDRVRHPAIEASLGPAGTFERHGRIDTLWVGLQPRELLASLHARIDGALRTAGVAPDGRTFLPHVTLARFSRGAAGPADAALRIIVPTVEPFAIERFALYESRLGSEGASYEPIAHYRLDRIGPNP